jgi:hypothetical protein
MYKLYRAIKKILNEKRHIAVVLQHVSLQDIGNGTEHSLESAAIKLDASEGTTSSDGCGPRPVQEQSDFAEIFRRAETSNLNRFASLVAHLKKIKFSFNRNVESKL